MKRVNSAVMALTFTAALAAGGCSTTSRTTTTNETATTQVTTESTMYGEAPLGSGYVSTDENHDATKNVRSNDNEAAPLGSSYGEFAADDGGRNIRDARDVARDARDAADDEGIVLGHRMSQKE